MGDPNGGKLVAFLFNVLPTAIVGFALLFSIQTSAGHTNRAVAGERSVIQQITIQENVADLLPATDLPDAW